MKFALKWLLLLASLTATLGIADNVDYRVSKQQRVRAQMLALRLDPAATGYTGETVLDITVTSALGHLTLHWVDLNISRIELIQDDQIRILTAQQAGWDMHHLADGNDIVAGEYRLRIEFAGEYSTDALGLYKTTEQGEDYLFTQFEMTLARRMVPSVDEPDTKIPWTAHIAAPKAMTVVANTPLERVTEEGEWRRYEFATTPPMPSYLLALAVGNFDVTPIAGLPVPGAIYSPKGSASSVGFSAEVTPSILQALESYFDLPYPYRKLDFVAVPNFTFGAMENVGLITYRAELLLNGDNPDPNSALSTVNVIAHELAHQWYGNLVTMAWWDDLWLNEAFASWMAYKITDHLHPDYMASLYLPQGSAFGADALAATSPIRKEVKTEEDVLNGLGLNYTKGHGILNMLERAMGAKAFRAGIRDYMKQHSWSNTQAGDLWAALDKHADFSVCEVAETFLNQAGFPLIHINADGLLTQRRYENLGANLGAQTWRIPMRLRIGTGDDVIQQSRTLADDPVQIDAIAKADWVLPAAGGDGYYVWSLEPQVYRALLKQLSSLSEREKLAVLINGERLLAAGAVDMGQHMALLTTLMAERNEEIARRALEGIREVGEMYRGTHIEPLVRHWVSETVGPWRITLGLKDRPNDTQGQTKMRGRVARVLAQLGNDGDLISSLQAMADAYLKDPSSAPAGLGIEALRINALTAGDAAMASRYIAAYKSTTNAVVKANLHRAMYFTNEAAIAVVVDAIAEGTFGAGDIASALSGLFYANVEQDALYALLQDRYEAIVSKLPEFYIPMMPQMMSPACDAANSARQQAFYSERGERYVTALQKSQESSRNCVGRKSRGLDSAEAFLTLSTRTD